MSWSSLYFPNYEATHISWYLMNNGHLLIVSVMSKSTVTIVIKLYNRPPIDHYNMSDDGKIQWWQTHDICFLYIKSSQLENRPFHLTGLPILTGSVCIILVNFIYICILICPSNHSCFVHTFYCRTWLPSWPTV